VIKSSCSFKSRKAPVGPRFELICEPDNVDAVRDEVWHTIRSRTKMPRMNVVKNRTNLIIIPDDDDTLEVLRATDKLRELGPKKPRVIIYNVESVLTEQDLIDGLRFQNPELKITEEEVGQTKPIYKTGPKNKDVVHWVVETPPNVLEKIKGKKIFLGLCRCNIKLYTSMTQCFKCQKFGHTAAKCRDSMPTCRNCAEGHDSRECKSEVVKCANCKGPHKASSVKCKGRDRATNTLLRRTDFGLNVA